MNKNFVFILNDHQFPIPKSLKFLTRLSEKVCNQLLFENEYKVESNVNEDHLSSFLNFLNSDEELPTVNSDNFYDYRLISNEFSIFTDFFSNPELENLYKISILRNITEYNDNFDKTEMEKYISQNLDLFLKNYSTEMYGIPFASLYNIFKHTSRKLTEHDIAYQFLTRSLIISTQNEEEDDNRYNYCILLSTLDSRQLTTSNLIDSVINREQHFGFIPSPDFSIIETLNQLFINLNIETNCSIKESLDELGQKFNQFEIENQQLKQIIEENQNNFTQEKTKLLNDYFLLDLEKDDLLKENRIANETIEDLQKENIDANKKIEDLQKGFNDLQIENTNTNEENAKLHIENEYLQTEFRNANEKNDDLQKENKNIIEENEKLQKENENLQKGYRIANNEIIELQKDNKEANKKIEDLQKKIDELNQKIHEMDEKDKLPKRVMKSNKKRVKKKTTEKNENDTDIQNNDSIESNNNSVDSTISIGSTKDSSQSNDNLNESNISFFSDNASTISIMELDDFVFPTDNQFNGSQFEIENIESLANPPLINDDKLVITFFSRSRLYDFRTNLTIKKFYIENKSESQSNIGNLLSLIKKDYSSINPNEMLKYNIVKEKDFKINFFDDTKRIDEINDYLFIQLKKSSNFRICVFFIVPAFDASDFDPNKDGIPFAIPYKNSGDIRRAISYYLFSTNPIEKEIRGSDSYQPTLFTFHNDSFEEIVDDNILEDPQKPIFVTMKSIRANELVFQSYNNHITNKFLFRPK